MAELYRRKVTELQVALQDPQFQEGAFELIRGLIDQIVLMPVGDRLEIETKVELAAILELCEAPEEQNPAPFPVPGLPSNLRWLREPANHENR